MTASCWSRPATNPVPGRHDRMYPFRAHSEYLYLTDRERPGGVLAFDPGEGWVEFVSPVSRGAALDGARRRPRRCAGGDPSARSARSIRAGPPGAPTRRNGRTGYGVAGRADRRAAAQGRDRAGADASRRQATRAGFAELVQLIEPDRSERELQVALEASFLRNGGDFLAFETIVAAGRPRCGPSLHADGATASRGRAAPRRCRR